MMNWKRGEPNRKSKILGRVIKNNMTLTIPLNPKNALAIAVATKGKSFPSMGHPSFMNRTIERGMIRMAFKQTVRTKSIVHKTGNVL